MDSVIRNIAGLWLWFALLCLILAFLSLRWARNAAREARYSIFSLEREQVGRRVARARGRALLLILAAVALYGLDTYVVPLLPEPPDQQLAADGIDLPPTDTPTPAPLGTAEFPGDLSGTVVAVPGATGVATATPTPDAGTPTPAPTTDAAPTVEPTPTTPPPPPAACPNPGVQITSPGMGATVSGSVAITGTANIDGFQFYKVEISAGQEPGAWSVVNDVQRQPVSGGRLDTWNAGAVPPGVYWLRLVVVDQSGNYPSPCAVRVTVQ